MLKSQKVKKLKVTNNKASLKNVIGPKWFYTTFAIFLLIPMLIEESPEPPLPHYYHIIRSVQFLLSPGVREGIGWLWILLFPFFFVGMGIYFLFRYFYKKGYYLFPAIFSFLCFGLIAWGDSLFFEIFDTCEFLILCLLGNLCYRFVQKTILVSKTGAE